MARRTTSLRVRTFSLIALIFLGLMLTLYIPLRLFLLDSFVELEMQDTTLSAERVLGAFSNELAALGRTAADYASWDDTYQFAMDQNQDYIEVNFVDDTFANLRLSFLVLADATGRPIYHKGFDLGLGEAREPPSGLLARPAGDPLLHQANPGQHLSGVLLLPEGPYLVVAQPILTSAYEGPARGTLVMGRALDDAELSRLSGTLRLPLTLYRLDGGELPAHVRAARPQFSPASPAYAAPLSAEVVAGYALFEDIAGQPALIVQVDLPRRIFDQGNRSTLYFFISLLVVGLLFCGAMLLLLERAILSRLARLGAEVTEIGSQGAFARRVTPLGDDELGLLATNINATLSSLETMHQRLQSEEQKSTELLSNILPSPVAARLKEQPGPIAETYPEASVLFCDIVDFTAYASHNGPAEVVAMLSTIFSCFDALAEQHGLEKIKTIGDTYMAVAGVPTPRPDHTEAMADMALAMQREMALLSALHGEPFQIRVGVATGPVIAGVISTKKAFYDVWGDTVNTASRMESGGVPGRIHVSSAVYERLRDRYLFEPRGTIEVKGKGPMETYFLVRRRSA